MELIIFYLHFRVIHFPVCVKFVGDPPVRQYPIDTKQNPLGLHNIIWTKEPPRAAKDSSGESLNPTHKSWQTPRDYLQQFAPTYSDPNKGWIVSFLDGVGGVSKAVAWLTVNNQPFNLIAVEQDRTQWEACATHLVAFMEKEEQRVSFWIYFDSVS